MKTLILGEMLTLYLGGLLTRYKPGDKPSEQIALLLIEKQTLQQTIAVLVLTAALLAAEEFGFGGPAAAFGGLITLGYLIANTNKIGQVSADFSRRLRTQ